MENESPQAQSGMPAKEKAEGKKSGRKPEFRVVQASTDVAGAKKYEDIGAMWKNTSKSGSDFYNLKIGKLKLLVFPNWDSREVKDTRGGVEERAPQSPSAYPKNQQGKI